MTDFVLEQEKNPMQTYQDAYRKIRAYAKFLKQPLTLGMFVPCVDNEPFNYSKHGNAEQFEKAKEKVLFEGFEIHELSNGETKRLTSPNGVFNIAWYNLEKGWYLSNGVEGMIIEDLLKYDLEIKNFM